jgi:hypothetical protein
MFRTGKITIPATLTSSCNGAPSSPMIQDFELGGGSTVGYRMLPASGYRLTGDVEFVFNGHNTAWFHWDLKPKEFKPSTSTCTFEAAIHDTAKLNVLRAVRNSIANTQDGLELIYLYYANTSEITKIILSNSDLRTKFTELIINNMPHAQNLINEHETVVTGETMQEAICFLNELKVQGSTKLNKDIEWVLQGIEDTSLLNSLGIRVLN